MGFEMDKYFDADGLHAYTADGSFEDPLAWWLLHKKKFPIVWLLAKYYLGIAGTSANSERCFSFTNKMLGPSRSTMKAENVGETFFVNRNFRMLPKSPPPKSKSRISLHVKSNHFVLFGKQSAS